MSLLRHVIIAVFLAAALVAAPAGQGRAAATGPVSVFRMPPLRF